MAKVHSVWAAFFIVIFFGMPGWGARSASDSFPCIAYLKTL